jgi:hypothetical protein
LPIGVLRQTNGTGLGHTFQSRGDVDTVAHQIAVALLDHIAQMDTDAKLDAPLGRKASVAFDHAVLHFDGAADCVNDASKFNDAAVASALHHTATMDSNGRCDQIAPECAQPRKRPLFVGTDKLAVPGYIAARMAASLRVSGMTPPWM